VLTGGDGDDRLTGGFGADRLTGGSAGRDTFIFEAVRESSEGEGIDWSDEIDLRDIDWSGDRGDQAFASSPAPSRRPARCMSGRRRATPPSRPR
jgi:hypothetical protein